MNKVKNQLTGEYGPVPDTARYYKVRRTQHNVCTFDYVCMGICIIQDHQYVLLCIPYSLRE